MVFDVVTFGSAVVDTFVNTDVSGKNGHLSYPVGSKILINNLYFDIGGGGTNTAVAFSRLGLKTGYLGKIGNDENGSEIIDLLKREKVKFLGKIGEGKTGYSVILDSKENNRTILTYKGENNGLSFKEINPRKIKAKWLYLTSLLGKSFVSQKKLVDYLTRKGTKVAFNPSEYLIKRVNLNPILRLTDILILNKEEARLLLKKNKIRDDLFEGLYSLGPKIVVVTDKNKRVVCFDGNKKYFAKPHNVKVLERTGAGDAFASGFVAGQIVGKSIEESLKLGISEGESVLRHFGAKNNLLKKDLKKEARG